MKRIALAIENFSRNAGGAESYAVSLAHALSENGWEIHVYGKRWDGEPSGASFHQIRVPDWLPVWIQLLNFAFCHRRMIRECRSDIILGFGNTICMNVYQSHGGVHKLSTDRKLFAEPNPFFRSLKRILIYFSLKQRVRHWIESAPFRQSPRPRIVAISEMIQEDIQQIYGIPDPIPVIYNGVDTSRFNPDAMIRFRGILRKKLGLNSGELLFLFASLELRKKGILPLLEASALLKNRTSQKFRILVAGGEPENVVKQKVRSLTLEDQIVFLGKIQNMEICYADADVFILPTYYDACSLVVIEAMASGLPVVTTRYNGASGIIRNGVDGYIVSHPPEPEEIARIMEKLMDSDCRKKIGKSAATTGSRFSAEKNHREMIRIFESIISGT
ncbi:MAG: glycosyltransferase family 4 protein [Thermodesulfobacteriota bacterium]